MADIQLNTATHTLRAYVQAPAGQGPWPGVVVLHDVLGQTADSRRQVEWLAAAGYLAICPDLYSWSSTLRCIRAVFRDMLARRGPTFEVIDAARAYLTERADCTGKIGALGFCLGGGFALLAATTPEYAAASVNYGLIPKDVDTLLQGACPIVGSFGARDYTLKGGATRLETALALNEVAHDVKEYPTVGHGFLNRHAGVAGWIMDRIGMKFNAPVAADAQARILAFFGRYLR